MANKSKKAHRHCTQYRKSIFRKYFGDKFEHGALGCHWCGILLTFKTSTLEHIVPINQGGSNSFSNRTVACNPCNQFRSHLDNQLRNGQIDKVGQEIAFRNHVENQKRNNITLDDMIC